MDYKRETINRINKIAGKYSPYEVFTDWIHCCSLAISNASTWNHNSVWKKREEAYFNIVKKYENDEIKIFSDMLGLLTLALEAKEEDVLGQIYMNTGMGSSAAGLK